MSGTNGLRAVLRAGERESKQRPSYPAGSTVPWFCSVRAVIGRALTDVDGAEFFFVPPAATGLIPIMVPATRLELGVYAAERNVEITGAWTVQFRALGVILDQREFDITPAAVASDALQAAVLTTPEGVVIQIDGYALGGTT